MERSSWEVGMGLNIFSETEAWLICEVEVNSDG